MTHVYLKFSEIFGFDYHIIKSWWEHKKFASEEEAKTFFQENKEIISAKPIVKWVGGKRQLIPQLQKLFPENFNNYHEPFLGGGAVFFNLQRKQSFLSDVNAELINLYQVVKNSPLELIKFLEEQIISKERFLEIRSWDREENFLEKYSQIERAGRFIYLNRTCFNGLYRVNSKGEFNVPFGKYTNPNIVQKENILSTSELLNKTEAVIKLQGYENVLGNVQKGDFVYFDPPYDVLSDSANFTSYNESGFGREEQIKLRDVFRQLSDKGVFIMLSNHNTPFIQEIYQEFSKGFRIVKANRNINSKGDGRGKIDEIVIINY